MRVRTSHLIRELAEMPLENEADVQRFFVPNLLRLLGYGPSDIRNEKTISQLYAAHGRQRVLLARPDFLVHVDNRCVIAIDAKTPKQRQFKKVDVEQVFSYARHLSIQAPYCMLTNGSETTVFESTTTAPLLTFRRTDLSGRLRDLGLLVGKASMGSQYGSVHLMKRLGSGGFGQVFKAWNPIVRRYEAIKIYPADKVQDQALLRRIRQGLKAHGKLQHPQIAQLYWAQLVAGELAVSMRFVEGRPLDRWIGRHKPSAYDRLTLIAGVADALEYAHSCGVYHRDLKPSNIVVEAQAGRVVPILVDFDTAVVQDATLITNTTENIGTLAFRDPHSAGSRRGATPDIYALGALTYWILTQDLLPLLGTAYNLRDIEKRLKRVRDLDAGQIRAMFCVILHCIDSVVQARYATVGAVAKDLRSILSGHQVTHESESDYVSGVFRDFDAAVEKHQVDKRFKNEPYASESELCRTSPGTNGGEFYVMYDFDYRWFMVGIMIDSLREFTSFLRGPRYRRLRSCFGDHLRAEGPSLAEQGGFYLQYPIGQALTAKSKATAELLAKDINTFMRLVFGRG